MNTASRARRHSWWLLAALMGLLLLLAAWRPLALPDEGRYAEISRWMWQSGDWLAPRLNGLPFFHKPPLLHWLQGTVFGMVGVSAWSARLVPALHAGLMLLGLYLSVRRAEGEKHARVALWMLGSSLGLLIGGQYVNHDMVVAAWISTAIWCMGAAFMHGERPDTRLALAGFAACALGVMSKGLIGIVLPGMVILAWLLYTGQSRKLLALPWLRGLAVFAVLALPWFVLGQRQYPALFDYLIIGQHFARYTGHAGQTFNNQMPLWFYPLVLMLLLFPWSLLALSWLRRGPLRAAWTRDRRAAAGHWASLLWIWLLVIVLFFSLPKSKIVGYIFPVLPPAAALLARSWAQWQAGERFKQRLFAVLAVLALALACVANGAAGRYSLQASSQDVARVLACAMQPDEPVYIAGDYPYDLPFYAGLQRAPIVVEDWDTARRTTGDNWRRELFEAADFEPAKGRALLQPPAALQPAPSGAWLVTPGDFAAPSGDRPGGWQNVYRGRVWALWLAGRSALEGPETSQQERLARCRQHAQHP